MYATSSGKCTSVTPSSVRPGGSESLSANVPMTARVVDAHVEIKADIPRPEWHPCQVGEDCGPPGDVILSPLKHATDQGGTSVPYTAVVTNKSSSRVCFVQAVLEYVP